jgi:exopolyphosphatase/pppGpp-phosphohydrolase
MDIGAHPGRDTRCWAHMNPDGLDIVIDDTSISISMAGGAAGNAAWTMPIGPWTLVERELERSPQPNPAQLTNALGIVTDHLDDVIREVPLVAAAPRVTIAGDHARVLAQVEIGSNEVPVGYSLERSDADEVFRTLVAEPISERIHNPGLPASDVETVIGTCCVVLAIMRRLELTSVVVVEVRSGSGD